MQIRRYRVLADLQVQGGLCVRVLFYWVFAQLAFMFALAVSGVVDQLAGVSQGVAWDILGRAFLISLLGLPLVILDILFFSNRLAGPLHRFRRSFHQLVQGQDVPPLNFRQGDFLTDLDSDFNLARAKLAERSAVSDLP